MLTVYITASNGYQFQTEIDADLDTPAEEVERLAFDAVSAWCETRTYAMSDLEWEVQGFGPEYEDEPWDDDDFPMWLEYDDDGQRTPLEEWYAEDW